MGTTRTSAPKTAANDKAVLAASRTWWTKSIDKTDGQISSGWQENKCNCEISSQLLFRTKRNVIKIYDDADDDPLQREFSEWIFVYETFNAKAGTFCRQLESGSMASFKLYGTSESFKPTLFSAFPSNHFFDARAFLSLISDDQKVCTQWTKYIFVEVQSSCVIMMQHRVEKIIDLMHETI